MTPDIPPRATPVFVDLTGRRGRKVKFLALLVVATVCAYVVMLFSAVLGGPTIHAPFLPTPDWAGAASEASRPRAASTASVGVAARDGRGGVGVATGSASAEGRQAVLSSGSPADAASAPTSPAATSGRLTASSTTPVSPGATSGPGATSVGSPTVRVAGSSTAAPGQAVRATRTPGPRTTSTRP